MEKFMNKTKLSRKDFLKFSGNILLAGLATSLAGLEYSSIESEWVEIKTVDLQLSRLPMEFNRYRLIQISDIHFDGWMTPKRISKTIDLINKLDADTIGITGDIISIDHKPYLEEIISEFKRLEAKDMIIGVLGNHDHWSNPSYVHDIYRESGIIDLCNAVITLEKKSAHLHFCGLDDYWEGHSRLDQVLNSLPDTGCAILLVHEPDFGNISTETGRFDLQISGHSHGGQVIIPFVGPPIVPTYANKYPVGLYKVNDMFLYTNKGLGMVIPRIRINCRPEITVFNLHSPKSS